MKLLEQLHPLSKEERPRFIRAYIEDVYTRSTGLLRELGLAHEQERQYIIGELQQLQEEAVSALTIVERFDTSNKLKMVTQIDVSKWQAIFGNARQSEKQVNKSQRIQTHHTQWHNDYGNDRPI